MASSFLTVYCFGTDTLLIYYDKRMDVYSIYTAYTLTNFVQFIAVGTHVNATAEQCDGYSW
jgi:hypothetical protein